MLKKLHRIAIKNDATGTEIARRPAPDLRLPRASDGWPKEITGFFGNQTDAGGARPAEFEPNLSEFLENGPRRVCHVLSEREQCAVLRDMIGWP
jgi:hypothetical protein